MRVHRETPGAERLLGQPLVLEQEPAAWLTAGAGPVGRAAEWALGFLPGVSKDWSKTLGGARPGEHPLHTLRMARMLSGQWSFKPEKFEPA